MSRKWLALFLAGLMCALPVLGMAEQAAFDATQVAPLLNAVTTAALGGEEETANIAELDPLPEVFTAQLIVSLEAQGLPATAEAIGSMMTMSVPMTADSAQAGQVTACVLQVLNADVSEDGSAVMLIGEVMTGGEPAGRRAVIELRKSDASPVGWQVCRFTVDDALLEEELTDGYFAQTMVEYLNSVWGYSVQYPAIFTEDLLVVTQNGIQAELADGSASFAVTRAENAEHQSLDDVLAFEQQMNPGTQVSTDEITGAGKAVLTDEEGVTHVTIFLVSDEAIYQAELNYPQAQEADFALYVDYMMNSFSADELGLG